MKFNGGAALSAVFAGISLAVVITAASWPFKTALFPVAIGVPVFFMAVTEFFINLFQKGEGVGDAAGFDFKLSDGDADSRTALRRTLSIFGWIFGFFILILLIGFPMAIPIFFVVFYRGYGKENWKISIGLSAVAWASFYGLFIWLLNVPFREGWILSLLD
ncbi:MAG: tripartite tricarboxylate transporter TctB family protein [Thermodesulfobacteriota bacterium]